MTVIIIMMILGIIFETAFIFMMWPPWRSQFASMAWLLIAMSVALIFYDGMILLATFQIDVPAVPALAVLLGKDIILGWRLRVIFGVRAPKPETAEQRRSVMTPLFFEVIPAKARKYVYAAVALAMIVWGAWQAAEGDWKVAIGSLITTLVAGLAHGNVGAQDAPPPVQDAPVPPNE